MRGPKAPSPGLIKHPAKEDLGNAIRCSRPDWRARRSPNGRPLRLLFRRHPRHLRCLLDRGAGGAGARPPPPRHVYRRDRRARAAPPRRRSDRQCDGRGGRGPCDADRGRARRRQPADHHRQWPRHPGRSAPQISRQVGARSDPDHAPFGRQVRGQGLCDLGRPARRRRQRRQRAVDRHRRRGRARQEALPPDLLARASPRSPLETVGAAPNRRGTDGHLHPRSRRFSAPDAIFKPARLYKLARSKAYLFAGVEIRWRCDPSLATDDVPAEAVFQFPGGLARPSRASRSASANAPPRQPFTGRQDFPDEPGPRRMGGRLAALVRRHAKAIIATPSRPPTAARTRRGCAPR